MRNRDKVELKRLREWLFFDGLAAVFFRRAWVVGRVRLISSAFFGEIRGFRK